MMKLGVDGSSGAAAAFPADKSMPRDARVMMAILKDMNICEYEPRVVSQLLEFAYRYISTILEDSRVLSTHARKKAVDIDDVKMAVQMYTEHNLTSPPSRDVLLEVAAKKNAVPLPIPKTSGGLHMPPDRYCLTACNYRLKLNKKKPGPHGGGGYSGGGGGGKNSSSSKTGGGGKASSGITLQKPSVQLNSSSSGGGAAVLPKIQIQSKSGGGGGEGQPMFSMTVNPVSLGGNGQDAVVGMKRKADEMERN